MSGKFRISTPDGSEFFVSELETLKRLYCNGRIDADTTIQTPDSEQSRPLREIFDLGQWIPVQQSNNYAGNAAENTPLFSPPTTRTVYLRYNNIEDFEEPLNPGLRAAGVLLIANSLLIALGLVFQKLQGESNSFAQIAPLIVVIDIILGGSLIFGKWQQAALVRACLGGVIFGLIVPFDLLTPAALLEGGLQLVITIGLLVLMYGERATITRLVLGITVTCLAWIGIHAVPAVNYALPKLKENVRTHKIETQIAPYQLRSRKYSDASLGISAELPIGWVMLDQNNPIAPAPTAKMLAINPRSGCFAVLLVETLPANTSVQSISDYLDAVLNNKDKNAAVFTDLGRSPSSFGNRPQEVASERMEVVWMHDGTKIHGWRSVCQVGTSYYILSGWSLEEDKELGFKQFLELEDSFKVTIAIRRVQDNLDLNKSYMPSLPPKKP